MTISSNINAVSHVKLREDPDGQRRGESKEERGDKENIGQESRECINIKKMLRGSLEASSSMTQDINVFIYLLSLKVLIGFMQL